MRGALAVTMLFYEVSAWLLAVLRAWRSFREDVKFWQNPRKSLNYIIFSQGRFFNTLVLAKADELESRLGVHFVSAPFCADKMNR